mmetsp:Transcript_30746/g.82329  ORF Transcript_30746/g.82329 Transcript_30746/m.82329 type:complete len:468 (-) Transcript_30746:264-1667(-)
MAARASLAVPGPPARGPTPLGRLGALRADGLRGLLDLSLAAVKLILDFGRDLLEHVLREDPQQCPCKVQGGEDVAVLVRTLRQELQFELVQELQIFVLVLAQGLFPDDGLHGFCVLALRVVGVQLIGHVAVVLASHPLADTRLHQPAKGRQHVDRRVDLPVVQGTVHEDLPLCNVPGQVRDGVRDVVVGHGQDGELRDGTGLALHTASALVDGGQVGVHVPGVATTSGHLLARGGHLAEGVGVGGHVGEDDEHVLLARVREVLGRGEGKPGRHDALDGGVVRQVHEQHDVLHGAVLLEVALEEGGGLPVHAHGPEHDAEVLLGVVAHVLALDQGGLPAHLCRDLVVRQTRRGEQRQLLPAHHRIHGVDRADAGLDHFLGVHARLGVERRAIDVQEVLRQHCWAFVDGLPGAVECAAQEIIRDRHLEGVARELDVAVLVVDIAGALEDLHNCLLLVHLEDLALPHRAI